jgi:hypothetical protein
MKHDTAWSDQKRIVPLVRRGQPLHSLAVNAEQNLDSARPVGIDYGPHRVKPDLAGRTVKLFPEGAGEYAEILQPQVPGPHIVACSGAVWETAGGSLTLSVILETVGASRWKIVWLPADCRRSV